MENSIYGKTDQNIYFTHAFLSSDVKRFYNDEKFANFD